MSGWSPGVLYLTEVLQTLADDQLRSISNGERPNTLLLSLVHLREVSPSIYESVVTRPDKCESDITDHLKFHFDSVVTSDEVIDDDEWDIHDEYTLDIDDDEYLDNLSISWTDPTDELFVAIGDSNVDEIGHLVAVEGICQRQTQPYPRLVELSLKCEECTAKKPFDVSWTYDMGDVELPTCSACESSSWEVLDEIRTEYQQVYLQEPPEDAEDSSEPRELKASVFGQTWIDSGQAGDRTTTVGVLCTREDTTKTINKPYLDVSSVITDDKSYDNIEVEPDVEALIREESKDPDVYDKLAASIAPSIIGEFEHRVKQSIVLQMMGGVTKYVHGDRKRGDINVLCLGEPSTGKSQIVKSAHRIAPHSIFTEGKTSTAAGLTATAENKELGDETTWVIKAGPLAQADKGFLMVDELDKASSDELEALNTGMEHGEFVVAKAGQRATLKSRISMLAAANPIDKEFDEYESIPDQFGFEPDFQSRFDLVWVFIDDPENHERDENIAWHILNQHKGNEDNAETDGGDIELVMDGMYAPEFVRKYVAYARSTCHPTLTDEAEEHLCEYYTKIRALYENDVIPIKTRQLEGLIRLATASAKVRLSEEVTVEDANRAIDLMHESLKNIAPEGESMFNSSRRETGAPSTSRKKRSDAVMSEFRDLHDERGGSVPEDELVESVSLDDDEARETVERLVKCDEITREGKYLSPN